MSMLGAATRVSTRGGEEKKIKGVGARGRFPAESASLKRESRRNRKEKKKEVALWDARSRSGSTRREKRLERAVYCVC